MTLTNPEAHKMFQEEHPDIQICPSTFYRRRPKYIKPLSKTPLTQCSCAYCTNINEKLKVFGISELKSEQELYKLLICKKQDGDFRSKNCISRKCKKCKEWKVKIEKKSL